jgi:UDPglucose 6-dehydrogenase
VGVESEKARELMERLYRPFTLNGYPILVMDVPSAEMTKYAANAMLATRISFMNDIANLCERVGANVDNVRKGMGSDPRIGKHFLYAGCGYGGSCFPKDVKALAHTGIENGYPMRVIEAVEAVNEAQKNIVFEKLLRAFDGDLRGKVIAMWGLSFKPETDDMREAPSLVVIEKLIEAGAVVRAYDPIAMEETHRRIGDKVTYCKDMYEAVIDADALALLTEWKQFRMPSWSIIRKAMRNHVVVDGRNIYDPKELQDNGFTYSRIGLK